MQTNIQRLYKLLQYILSVAGKADLYSRELGKIHLIKYAYLADLAYAKRHEGETYTGLTWKFHSFGPWSVDCFNAVEPALEAIGAQPRIIESDKYKDTVKWQKADYELFERLNNEIDLAVAGTVQKCVREFGNDTYSLLDYVYKTRPMLMAAPGDTLDFKHEVAPVPEREEGAEKPALTAHQRKIRSKKILEFKESLNKRLEDKARSHKLTACPKPPRYDDIFFEGLAKLDESAGTPLAEGESLAVFTDRVWKSKARYDPELS